MLSDIRRLISSDRTIALILIAGFLVQLVTSITQIGVSSADQHFQIVEFSLYQLGKANGAIQVWEIENFVRPTVQVYLFTGYHQLCNFIGITDPYLQLTILRVLLGVIMWAVFNGMVFHYFGKSARYIFISVLLLMNFTWALPYSRTLFSAEMMGSLAFFGGLLLYEQSRVDKATWPRLFLVGVIFCLAFYFRFQMAFAFVGLGLWIIFFTRQYRHLIPMIAGFVAAFLLNLWLDHEFYKEWVVTPYTYFYANIIDGRADFFGRSPFWRYIGLILLITPAPLFSFIIFVFLLLTTFKQYKNPIVLSVFFFVLFHCLVGHKEERFIFPVFNAFPLFIGLAIPDIQKLFHSGKKGIAALMCLLLGTSVFINTLLLGLMMLVPFAQTILFSKKLHEHFRGRDVTLFSIRQTPFETPSGNQMEFYKDASRNIKLQKIEKFNLATIEWAQPKYLAVSYNDVKGHFDDLSRLGYRPVLTSSELLWGVNDFLHARKINTINEIWMLYEK